MEIKDVLLWSYPGAQWSMLDNTYETLEWLDDSPKPTKTELEELWPTVQAEMEAEAQAKVDARASAISKLEALGLTVDEVQAAFGISAEV